MTFEQAETQLRVVVPIEEEEEMAMCFGSWCHIRAHCKTWYLPAKHL
jgi:hypothetical protein